MSEHTAMQMEYRTISVRGIIRKDDQILTEWDAIKSISFPPGGTVEPNEELESALIRELGEELLGVKFRIGRYLGKIGHFWNPNCLDSCLNHFYEVFLDEDFGVSAKEENREVKWLSLNSEQVLTLQPPSLRLMLQQNIETNWDLIDRN